MNMNLNYQKIHSLSQEYGPSFYLFDIEKLHSNYSRMKKAFQSRYDNCIIGYSYKTNYLPYLCKEMNEMGGFAEVVSRLEYDLALKVGVPPTHIIFNGPVKSYEDIETALLNESIINIDSSYEVDYIEAFIRKYQNRQVKIGIRLNFEVSKDGTVLQEGHEISRFGICTVNGDLERVLQRVNDLDNVSIIGFHGHFSTRERKVETYVKITEELCHLTKRYISSTVEYLDIGGGFYGELPSSFQHVTPSFEQYAEPVCSIMNEQFPIRKPALIIEPGISLVADPFTFIARVIENKRIKQKDLVLIDGSVHNIKPTMHKRNLPMRIDKDQKKSNRETPYSIVGYTCMEKDYLAYDISGPLPERNDYIQFENVGAYTIVFNPPFIKERPAIIAVKDGDYFPVRKRETFHEFFNEKVYIF